VIDNADILLDDKMRQYIAFDAQNQYVIIGRNPTGLMLELDEIYELSSENINGRTLLSLKKSF
jgi:ABC transporter, ATP-binding protein